MCVLLTELLLPCLGKYVENCGTETDLRWNSTSAPLIGSEMTVNDIPSSLNGVLCHWNCGQETAAMQVVSTERV